MEKFLLMLLLCHVSSSEKHFLEFFSAGSSGIPNFPDFFGILEVDGIAVAFCDSNKTLKINQDWVESLMQTDPIEGYKRECFERQPLLFKAMIIEMMQSFKQSEGVHVLQRTHVCEWDDENDDFDCYMKYAYDGEDILSFDRKSLTMSALKPEAVTTKLSLSADREKMNRFESCLTVFLVWLKTYVDVGKSSLTRKVLPSVSLLQKSPSSPITCHATGFFPKGAVLFWKKDGEELYEDVENGEILPNQDGSFQMSVELLKLPSEDWGKYECVFQLSGVKEDMVTKLHKNMIRTNYKVPTMVDPGVVIGLFITVLFAAAVSGFMFYRRYKATKTRTEGPNSESETTSMNPSS